MESFNSNEDINLLSKVLNSAIDAIKNSSIYEKLEFIFLTLFFIYFLLWIFLNIFSKIFNRINKKYVPNYICLTILPFLVFLPVIIEYYQNIFKKDSNNFDFKNLIMNYAKYFMLFQIIDILSIFFILILLIYRFRNYFYFNYKNLSFKMKISIIIKLLSYIMNLLLMIFYFNIDNHYLNIFLILIIINDLISRLVTLTIMNKLEKILSIQINLSNNVEDSLNIEPPAYSTLIMLEDYRNCIDNNDRLPSYEECMKI